MFVCRTSRGLSFTAIGRSTAAVTATVTVRHCPAFFVCVFRDVSAHCLSCLLAFWTAGATLLKVVLEKTLFDGGVDLFLNGHEHNYERNWPTYRGKSTQSNVNAHTSSVGLF